MTDLAHQPSRHFQVRDLVVRYGDTTVLGPIDWSAPHAGLVAVIGPNGAGKSTLLKAALGLVPVATGEVRWFGIVGGPPVGRVAYVPQRGQVDLTFPISAREVVEQGLYPRMGWFRRPGAAERAQAMQALASVGMTEFAERPIGELSGGQQQRVFVARALAQQAEVVLLDEPFAGIDATTEAILFRVLRDLADQGRLVLVVHHDLASVARHFDEVVL
ncbi:MAG TPA: ABC transporter ATP-binding protein, partial [Geminicoccus sp.]|uniref:metal ABC transporter ATP-binding protein n=1 Tax=Geminicoccus sp. TaxID=2024832 RepID=UPI002E3730FE